MVTTSPPTKPSLILKRTSFSAGNATKHSLARNEHPTPTNNGHLPDTNGALAQPRMYLLQGTKRNTTHSPRTTKNQNLHTNQRPPSLTSTNHRPTSPVHSSKDKTQHYTLRRVKTENKTATIHSPTYKETKPPHQPMGANKQSLNRKRTFCQGENVTLHSLVHQNVCKTQHFPHRRVTNTPQQP